MTETQLPESGNTQSAQSDGWHADAARIARDVDAIAKIGGGPGGVTRPGYSVLEREAHSLVGGWLNELGLQVEVDVAGNTIAELPGKYVLPGLGVGSHLDSVPNGGKFDGTAGVVIAVEVVRLLLASNTQLSRPLRVVCFAAEEGARFGQACLGSRAVAGLLSRDVDDLVDQDGVSAEQAMHDLGLAPHDLGPAAWKPRDWSTFVEVHVEQGTDLESHGCRIGLVDLVSGSTRLEFQLVGRASHSGGTPMVGRADALAAAAEVILTAEAIAMDPRHHGTRATVGRIQVSPGSITTIVGRAVFSLDVRDIDSDRQRSAAAEIVRRAEDLCERRRVVMKVKVIGDTSPVVLPSWVRNVLATAVRAAGVDYRIVVSGASHDAQLVNVVVPSGVMFLPSLAGLSHVADEWTSSEDLALGAEILCRALVELDAELCRLEGGL